MKRWVCRLHDAVVGRCRAKTQNRQVLEGRFTPPEVPRGRLERSDKPNFAQSESGVRFDTAWATTGRSAMPADRVCRVEGDSDSVA